MVDEFLFFDHEKAGESCGKWCHPVDESAPVLALTIFMFKLTFKFLPNKFAPCFEATEQK